MVRKYFLLLLAIFSIQNLAFASHKSYDLGSLKLCSNNDAIQIRNLKNGYSQVKTNVGGFETYEIMNSADAVIYKGLFNEGFKNLPKYLAEEQKQERIRIANSKLIVKRTAITTSEGVYIALEEDKNGDDFLVVQNQRKRIGKGLVKSQFKERSKDNLVKPSTNSLNQHPSEYPLVEAYKIVHFEDSRYITYKKPRSYVEIISEMSDLDELFKLVFSLRAEYGVSYEDALKLMTFRNDNNNFNPDDLLLPVEIGEKIYQKNHKKFENEFKNFTYPNVSKKNASKKKF